MKSSRSAWASIVTIVVPVAAIALTSGCASVANQSAGTEVDTLTVARVEQAAKQMGTTVIWVNYPTRASHARAQPAVTK